jgi:hypothetical protein
MYGGQKLYETRKPTSISFPGSQKYMNADALQHQEVPDGPILLSSARSHRKGWPYSQSQAVKILCRDHHNL